MSRTMFGIIHEGIHDKIIARISGVAFRKTVKIYLIKYLYDHMAEKIFGKKSGGLLKKLFKEYPQDFLNELLEEILIEKL